MRLMGRALWWYTQQVRSLGVALVRQQTQDERRLAALARQQDALKQEVQQLHSLLLASRTEFNLRCSELESAQILTQSMQLDHATLSELSELSQRIVGVSEEMGRLRQSVESFSSALAAIRAYSDSGGQKVLSQ